MKTSALPSRAIYGPEYLSPSPALPSGNDGMTEQSHKHECDINQILAKFQQTGLMDHINEYSGQYGDIDSIDFTEAQNIIATGNSMFAELPSSTREHFDNNPTRFLAFVGDPANENAMIKLGLANVRPSAEQVETLLNPPLDKRSEATTSKASESEAKPSSKTAPS
nr:MAG: internal scaffolding protein [Microvirus sp.]